MAENCDVEKKDDVSIIRFKDAPLTRETLNNIVFFEFNVKSGDAVKKGDKLLSLEALKGTAELASPIDGVVVDVNTEIEDNPESLKEEPTKWLIKIKS